MFPYGHSIVVNPWAEVEEDLGTAVCEKVVDIDLDKVNDVRAQIPLGRK